MEEITPSSPPSSSTVASGTTAPDENKQSSSHYSIKRACLSFAASLNEGLAYVKAIFVGQAKRMTARNETEAAQADLQTAKMEVDAADAAENTKKSL